MGKLTDAQKDNMVHSIMPQLIESGFVEPIKFKTEDFEFLIPTGKLNSESDSDMPKFKVKYRGIGNTSVPF